MSCQKLRAPAENVVGLSSGSYIPGAAGDVADVGPFSGSGGCFGLVSGFVGILGRDK